MTGVLDLQPITLGFDSVAALADIDFACHKDHRPHPEVVHRHHVVIQAWQQHFKPLGVVANSDGIWAPATVVLPPSCHYAVHNRLVLLMRAYGSLRISHPGLDQLALFDLVAKGRPHGHGNLADIAESSPLKWIELGMSLDDLTNNHLWGQL